MRGRVAWGWNRRRLVAVHAAQTASSFPEEGLLNEPSAPSDRVSCDTDLPARLEPGSRHNRRPPTLPHAAAQSAAGHLLPARLRITAICSPHPYRPHCGRRDTAHKHPPRQRQRRNEITRPRCPHPPPIPQPGRPLRAAATAHLLARTLSVHAAGIAHAVGRRRDTARIIARHDHEWSVDGSRWRRRS